MILHGVPEILVVMTISSIPDLTMASLYSLLTWASVLAMNRVPIEKPCAPEASMLSMASPVAIPHAATIGILGNCFSKAGIKICKGLGPACPPAPCPTAINPSQFKEAHFAA